MRIILIHKSDAGDGGHEMSQVLARLEQLGHEVRYCMRDEDWRDQLRQDADLVLIAGGDGTVSKVVRKLIGTGLPFGILPLGTANNIATDLGWTAPVEELTGMLEHTRPMPFTIGVARGPWGAEHFLEGVGTGPFTSAMSFAKRHKAGLLSAPPDRAAKLRRDLQLVHAFLTEGRPQRWQVDLDGESFDGDYLLVEVMNTGRVGPGLQLAPGADLSDEELDVVFAGETEREVLSDYLERRQEGPCAPPALPGRRARHIRMIGEAARIHIDDDVWPKAKRPPPPVGTAFEIDIQLDPRPVTALVPTRELVESR